MRLASCRYKRDWGVLAMECRLATTAHAKRCVSSRAAPQLHTAPSDATLAHRIGLGDTAALEALMGRYNRMLIRTARAILRDDADAEEALQDTYLKVFHSIARFRGESKLSTWLVRIAINEALACRRKRAPRAGAATLQRSGGDAESRPDLQADIVNVSEQPDHMAMRRQTQELLESTIGTLPHRFRTVFMLRAIDEYTVKETAEALGIPPATVRTRFFRARGLLRELLSTSHTIYRLDL
jgi:RNA polymerase sigma-70 factor (ECF subfamily)